MKEANNQVLQFALRYLDTAYVNFFKGNTQLPKFNLRKHKNTFIVLQFDKFEDGKIILSEFKDDTKVKSHRGIKKLPKTNKQVGIVLGLKDFVTLLKY